MCRLWHGCSSINMANFEPHQPIGQDFDNVGIGFQFDRHEVGHVKE